MFLMGPPQNKLGEKNKKQKKQHHNLSSFEDVGFVTLTPYLQLVVVSVTQPRPPVEQSEMYSYSSTSGARVATARTHTSLRHAHIHPLLRPCGPVLSEYI